MLVVTKKYIRKGFSMKRVLVTGASGTIGIKTIKYLLSEGKYDVTALEIKNRKHYKALKMRQRIRKAVQKPGSF